MRLFAKILIGIFLVLCTLLGGTIAFSRPGTPPPLTSIAAPFKTVDFSDLPTVTTFAARDGTQLAYRRYAGDPDRLVILIHGSAGSGTSMHAVAKALAAAGATVIALDIRGHGRSGSHGDIAYIGQLEDDLEDLLDTLDRTHKPAETTLIGFSSGGGFAIRIAGSRVAAHFSRIMLLAPYLSYDAPNMRPVEKEGGGWTDVAVPRIVALSVLTGFGVTAFNGLPVVAFAVAAGNPNNLTATYSYRLLTDFQPDRDYLGDLRRFPRPVMAIAGADDEIFFSDKLRMALSPAEPAIPVTIVPGVNHIGLITSPAATAAIAKAWASKF